MSDKNHVSRTNQNDALENIGRKIALLQHWARSGLPLNGEVPEFCPVSLRQFNTWKRESIEGDGSVFTSNAAATLRNNSALTKQVLALIDAIRRNESLKVKRRPVSDLAVLRQQLTLEKTRRAAVERQFVKSRADLQKIERHERTLRIQLENQEREARIEILSRDDEITRLREENKILIQKLSNVAPLAGKRL